MISLKTLQDLFKKNKERSLCGRYINNQHILPLLNVLKNRLQITQIGNSVLNKPIYSVVVGSGQKKVLMWSQMHGNESTTTKAVFDILNTLKIGSEPILEEILNQCTITIIPILNPDGSEVYTRVNANKVDLNRDAQDLTQPESKILREVFNQFKPDFCFNLHGQRTIFSAGNTNNSATVSFLSPAQNSERTITKTRKQSMEVIAAMNTVLQKQIPNQVGVYDDSFNINCVGDTFQSLNVPTILFEAGHYQDDYQREQTREFIYQSILTGLLYIANNKVEGKKYKQYLKIPENQKLFFDILVKQANYNGCIVDIAIQFEEVLKKGKITFIPILKEVGNLSSNYGHREILASKNIVKLNKSVENQVFEIVIVKKNEDFYTINLM